MEGESYLLLDAEPPVLEPAVLLRPERHRQLRKKTLGLLSLAALPPPLPADRTFLQVKLQIPGCSWDEEK